MEFQYWKIISMLEEIQEISHNKGHHSETQKKNGGSQIPEGFKNNMPVIIQGKCSATQIWYIPVSVILTALRGQGFGIHLSNSFIGKLTQILGLRYVDDCELIQSGDKFYITHQYMQDALSEWEALTEVSGGCLAPNKSAWYSLD